MCSKTQTLAPCGRAQTNLDFSIALLIIASFLGTTIFFGGSFIYDIGQNELDYSLQAQESLNTLEHQLQSGDSRYLDQSEFSALVESGDVDDYLALDEGFNGNLTFEPVDTNNPPSAFATDDTLYAGKDVPNTVTSSARTTLRVDNREVRVTLTLWRDT